MQTIPDRVLEAIARAKPHLAHLVQRLQARPPLPEAMALEKYIAQNAMLGYAPAGLSAMDIWHLASCYYGRPWAGDWCSLAEAAEASGYDASHLRRLIAQGKLTGHLRGKTWYVRHADVPLRDHSGLDNEAMFGPSS